MLKLRNIYKTFHVGTINERRALDDINLVLNDGDFVTVIGGNGAGKSTLQNVISGTINPDFGTVEIICRRHLLCKLCFRLLRG